jgi:hypothetical protein
LDPHKDTDLVKGERKLTCYGKLLFKGTWLLSPEDNVWKVIAAGSLFSDLNMHIRTRSWLEMLDMVGIGLSRWDK